MRTDRPRPGRAALRVAVLAALAALVPPAPVAAQQAGQICGDPTSELQPVCVDGLLAMDRMRAALSVGHAGGAALPGSASTLGRRFGATPRFGLAARVGFTRFEVPGPDGWGSGDEDAVLAPTLSASVAVGLLDGFSLAPTVGGVLALDLIGDVSTLRLPSGDGFEDPSTAWGYGVRIGLLRESFTLPGASVSVIRRTGAGATLAGSEGSVRTDVTTTSIRGTVGKELLGFGLLGGVGWDRADADWELEAGPAGSPIAVSLRNDDETVFSVFGGITRTFLIAQFGLEAGWTDGIFFGSAGLRLTL